MAGLLDTIQSGAGSIVEQVRGLLGMSPTQAAETTPAEATAAADRDYIVNFIADREGHIPTARIPTRGDRLTVGYGHTQGVRQGQTMTEEEARQALSDDIDSRLPEIRRAIPQYDNLTAEAQAPLLSEWFRGSLVQSTATRRLINQGRYDQAATEFLDNREYRNAVRRNRRGIRGRMEETSNAIRNMGNSVR